MVTSAPTLYVEPDRTGRWIVRRDGDREFLSRHETANDAGRAARALARDDAETRVLFKDRYQRIRQG